ncbi:hypothetical protein BDW74DRAFT_179281 [Aspergillus multicolor]|uniref:uncharacterized protein n=1 Tax=Aspergillus multicolor TaxID=41759 RepID=UPI003CCCCB78
MNNLPKELIDEIAKQAFNQTDNNNKDVRTLLELRRVNRSFRDSTTRVLFRSISIHIGIGYKHTRIR